MRCQLNSNNPVWLIIILTGLVFSAVPSAADFEAICIGQDRMDLAAPFEELELAGEPEPYSTMSDGRVLAAASLRGDGVDSTNNGALVLLSPNEAPIVLLREAQEIAGGFFRQATQVTSDDAGNIVILAVIGEEIYPGNRFNGAHFFAILAGQPDSLSVIASSEGGGQIGRVRQSRSGQVAFVMDRGIWTWNPDFGSTSLLVPENAELPGLPENSTLWPVDQLEISVEGDVLIGASLRTKDPDDEDAPTIIRSGLWLVSLDGQSSAIALEGDPAPTQPGFTYQDNFTILSFNENGWIVFNARTDDDGEFPFSGVTLAGNVFDGAYWDLPEPPEDSISGWLVGRISDNGQLLSSRESFSEGVFWITPPGLDISESGDWIEVVRLGSNVPGVDGELVLINAIHLGADGTLVFDGNTPDFGSQGSIWVRDPDTGILEVAVTNGTSLKRNGDTISIRRQKSLLPVSPSNDIPLYTSYSAGGGMQVIRNGAFPFIISDVCTAILPLEGATGGGDNRATLSMHRYTSNGLTFESIELGKENADAPLLPVTSPLTLGTQPQVRVGLIADGVTPLLFTATINSLVPGTEFRAELETPVPGSSLTALYTSGSQVASWRTASATSLTVDQAGDKLFFSLPPVDPSRLADDTVTLNSKVLLFATEEGTEERIAEIPFSVRRPPLYLNSIHGNSVWSADVINAFRNRRGIVIIRGAGTESSVQALRSDWALTRLDVVSHGNGLLDAIYIEEEDFRSGRNFYRGWARRFVAVGSGGAGGDRLTQYLKELIYGKAVPVNFLQGIPASFRKAQAARNFSANGPEDLDDIDLDSAARVHILTTGIPNDPQRVPIFRYIGLNEETVSSVFPYGSDGLTDRNNALAIGPFATSFEPWQTIYPDEALAHTLPHLLGTERSQTSSPALAHAIMDILDAPDSSGKFRSYSSVIRRWQNAWGDVNPNIPEEELLLIKSAAARALENIIEDVFGISPQISVQPSGITSAPKAPTTTIELGVTPPSGLQIVGEVIWLAEVIGPDGINATGLTLNPSGPNRRNLSLTIHQSVIGDVLVYASYQTDNDKTVFVQPYLAAQIDPESSTVNSIEVAFLNNPILSDPLGDETPSPEEVPTFETNAGIVPQLFVNYSDGTQVQRTLSGDTVNVSSGSASIVDVSDPSLWQATGEGQTSVTVSAFGQVEEITIRVENRFEAETYTTWKARIFTESELADSSLTGDSVDLDGDGLNLANEFLSGGNPRDPEQGLGPSAFLLQSGSEEQLGVSFSIAKSVSGLTGHLQFSTDYAIWSNLLALPLNAESANDSRLSAFDFPKETTWIFLMDPPTETGAFRIAIDPE